MKWNTQIVKPLNIIKEKNEPIPLDKARHKLETHTVMGDGTVRANPLMNMR